MNVFASPSDPKIFTDVSSSQQTTADAWQHFVSTGELTDKRPRQVITQSWLRCQDLGINPLEKRARSVISSEEIEAKLHTEYLGLSGKDVLDRMAQTVEGTGHVIVMADNNGRILYSVGHNKIQHKLEEINFRPGGYWSEEDVGPNGIGTPLLLNKPELVMGSEHYCQAWQPWVCYGAPIHNPVDRSVIGCIDITGPVEYIQAGALALAESITHSVEFNLSNILFRRREILREAFHSIRNNYPNDALLLLDESGNIVDSNGNSQTLLSLPSCFIFNNVFNQLPTEVVKSIKGCLTSVREKECEVSLANQDTYKCIIKPVVNKKECLGVVMIVLDNRFNYKQTVQNPKRSTTHSFENLIGQSRVFRKTLELAAVAARDASQNSVLLTGETGTGKDLIAHAIHTEDKTDAYPFIAVNCSALPKDLIESELFGYCPGAFSGAKKNGQIGKFEAANNGTLFLDEIDSLDLDLQAKLLRVLDNKKIIRLGSVAEKSINVRIIAASGVDLLQAVEEGKFRRDLFYRLNVIAIPVPALRERGKDIILLLNYFIEQESIQTGKNKLLISNEVKDKLLSYNWPGNIRELRNLCSRWMLTVYDREIQLDDLSDNFFKNSLKNSSTDLRSIEDDLIRKTLTQTNGNISRTAKILGINRSTIYRRYNRLKIN